jgi:hypothetical protein
MGPTSGYKILAQPGVLSAADTQRHFARAFDRLLSEGVITEVNLYRATGLKPKYQRAYFDYAKSITGSELQKLELEDE